MTQTQWREWTTVPLTIAAIGFVAAYAWRVVADLDPLSPDPPIPEGRPTLDGVPRSRARSGKTTPDRTTAP